jgi:hypothetical protein
MTHLGGGFFFSFLLCEDVLDREWAGHVASLLRTVAGEMGKSKEL